MFYYTSFTAACFDGQLVIFRPLQYMQVKLWQSQSSNLYLCAQVANCGYISSLTYCSRMRLSFLGTVLPAPEICTPGDRKIHRQHSVVVKTEVQRIKSLIKHVIEGQIHFFFSVKCASCNMVVHLNVSAQRQQNFSTERQRKFDMRRWSVGLAQLVT